MAKTDYNISDKKPPQSLEAEKSLLGCLLMDETAGSKVIDILIARDFYKERHRHIFEAVLKLFEKGDSVDLLTVSNCLMEKGLLEKIGGRAYLTELVNTVPTAAHILEYANIVQKKRVLRDLIEASYDISRLGHNEEEDIDIVVDKAEERIFGIAEQQLRQDFVSVKSTLEGAFERIDRLSKNKGVPNGLSTGYKGLDNILAGLQKSNLILLAARPSVGKSALAMNIASHVALHEKAPVGIFSLEMSRDELVDRLIAFHSGIDLWRLRTGRISGDEGSDDFDNIQRALGVLSEMPIYIDDSASSNILQMRAMARRLQARKGLSLLIIDYLQLIQPRIGADSIVRQITEVSRALKGIARELDVPVLALSQLSRAVERRIPPRPILSDLRESGCVTGDTLITRADTGQRICIKDLVGEEDIPIHTLGKDWKLTEGKISKVFYSGEKRVYKLRTRSGFKIKASANHKFRKLEGWQRLDELQIGDRIATPRQIELSNPRKMRDEEIILLAHLLGDGCILPRQPFHYTNSDWENIKIVEKTAKILFGIRSRIVKQKNWWHVYLSSPYPLARGKHHPITNWYKQLGIERVHSYKKEIPQIILGLDKKKTALFLKHLWATDGSISIKRLKGRKPNGQIYYATTSPKLAETVKHLLLRFGIRSKLTSVQKANYRPCYHINIRGKWNQLTFLREIGAFGARGEIIPQLVSFMEDIESNPNVDVIPQEVWPLFVQKAKQESGISWREFSQGMEIAYSGDTLFKTGVGLQRMTRIATYLQSGELHNLADSGVFWDEIVSIQALGIEKVYDATVLSTHNFVADNIVIHNSLEQDADVVMFIYKEREKESNRYKNEAEVIIAKHRNGPVGVAKMHFDERTVSFHDLETRYDEPEL